MNNVTNKYPKYIRLKNPNPYEGGVVICNGIKVSENEKTLIVNPTMMKKLCQIEKYIEEIENV